MKYYYVVYEARDQQTDKWIKNAKGITFGKYFDYELMKELLKKEECVSNLCILNYIKMTKKEYSTLGEKHEKEIKTRGVVRSIR